MSPQLHVTVVQSQAKPPLLGVSSMWDSVCLRNEVLNGDATLLIINIRDPAFCLVPASQFSYNCKLCSVTPWSSLCLWLPKFFKYFENELGATVIFGLFAIYWRYFHLLIVQYNVADALCGPDMLICWWVLISLMIWRQLKSGQLREDIRSGNLIPYNSFART
ncbi:hypothetical protein CUMW_231360 [Citrus unshiu]|uniref:Uncharacterized protein n=1 Tax=Citrus unshiu TaxID=55188 RepID=A0A2H5QHP1_CITUN|nr:hypothetical protein CUMW_231360 [Citrus unshiu]